ncbi:MAG: hypothetical protein IPH20_24960 [Bacteroidales bacterium]|nr:hypothetical protein [Bacteroidales bacterium]
MSSPITVNIRMAPYLIQYLENKYGPQPIAFPRKDRFGSVLPQLTRKPTMEEFQFEHYGPSTLTVVLPFNQEKNVLYHNFIPASAQAMFESMIHKEFLTGFHSFMNDAYNCKVEITESINVFIDIHRMDYSCFDMLVKERQRYMNGLRLNRWRQNKKRQLNDQIVRSATIVNA